MIGTRLGPYEILAAVGAGGMGDVYRARDTRLGRDVAIKVAREQFGERFEREAKAISALNHPNVCTLHDVGPNYLVMELVEGDTLADTIARAGGALPLDQALVIARQMVEALAAAHEKGITHRDLKPGNVKISREGVVKVLDFGLAKMASAAPEKADESPTFTAATRAGVILGTAAYMSPEQARGATVDKRTDIWAFGAVLFEMLTGRRAFAGDSVTDILAAVVREEPDFGQLPAPTPPSIRRLLSRCLVKDRRKRLPDIGVALLEIDDAVAGSVSPALPAPRPSTRVWPWVVTMGALVALAVVSWLALPAPRVPSWTATQLGGAEISMAPRISPDGQLVAFLAMVGRQTQVAVMKPGTGNWTVLTHERTRGIPVNLAWSADSARVYFDRMTDAPRGIYSVPVLGGDERTVIDNVMGPAPLPDGSFVVQRPNADRQLEVYRVWPETGRTESLKMIVPWTTGGLPYSPTPSGDRVVVGGTPLTTPGALPRLYTVDLASARISPLADVPLPQLGVPLVVEPHGRSALVVTAVGDLYQLLRVPLDGSSAVHSVLTFTNRVEYLDVGRDGAIYVDQRERPVEVYRVADHGQTRERVAELVGLSGTSSLPLPDGRLLMNSRIGGREVILLAAPDKELVPFVETPEQHGRPFTLLGNEAVAFTIGRDATRTIALASIATRRITRRLEGPKGADFDSMVVSPDGKILHYAAGGSIWSVPVDDGTPKRIRNGDSVTMDPYRRELIIRLSDAAGTRLVRQPLDGGPERPIDLKGGLPIAPWHTWSSSVSKEGRLLLPLAIPSSWYWPLGEVDLATGQTTLVNVGDNDGDMGGGWGPDGRMVVNAMRVRSRMWRFVAAGEN